MEFSTTYFITFPITFCVIQNTEGVTSNSPGKHTVDPLMVRYMKIIQSQREKVEPLLQQTSKEDTQLSEELFVIETGERLNTSSTPSDFGW